MNLIDKAFLLKRTSLFGSLDLDLLLTIADKLELIKTKSDGKIFELEQDAYRMYLIVYGKVVIRDKQGDSLGELSEGDFFGDEAMFNERPRGYEAVCQSPVTLLALSRSHLLGIIAECPSVAVAFLEAYSSNLDFRQR